MRLSTVWMLSMATALTACSTTVMNTNRSVEMPTPTVAIFDTVATVEVGEQVTGSGCASDVLMFGEKWRASSGATYLQVHGASSEGIENRAKSIATHQALTGSKGLTTDILVHPVWEIRRSGGLLSFWRDEVCANVVGYRGVIKSFKTLETSSQLKPKEQALPSGVRKFFGEF